MLIKDILQQFGILKSDKFRKGDIITSESNEGCFYIGVFKDEVPNKGLCYILESNSIFFDKSHNIVEYSNIDRFGKHGTRLANNLEIAIYNEAKQIDAIKINVQLEKYDVINLIRGIDPNYKIMQISLYMNLGKCSGGFSEEFRWKSFTNECGEVGSIGELYGLYLKFKELLQD